MCVLLRGQWRREREGWEERRGGGEEERGRRRRECVVLFDVAMPFPYWVTYFGGTEICTSVSRFLVWLKGGEISTVS